MTEDDTLTRQQALPSLEQFCRGMEESSYRMGMTTAAWENAVESAVTGECERCGIVVSGVELLALGRLPSPEHGTAKLGRLRLGDCAREGCVGYHYRLVFRKHHVVDWTRFLAFTEQPAKRRKSAGVLLSMPGRLYWILPARSAVLRWCVLSTVVCGILMARQWYLGGRIPFLREPEQFQVDVRTDGIAEPEAAVE